MQEQLDNPGEERVCELEGVPDRDIKDAWHPALTPVPRTGNVGCTPGDESQTLGCPAWRSSLVFNTDTDAESAWSEETLGAGPEPHKSNLWQMPEALTQFRVTPSPVCGDAP